MMSLNVKSFMRKLCVLTSVVTVMSSFTSIQSVIAAERQTNDPAVVNSRKPIIYIDPVFGGSAVGAPSFSCNQNPSNPGCVYSKNINLLLGLELKEELKKLDILNQLDIRLTRNSDVFVSNQDRVSAANNARADLYVAVIADAYTSPAANGTGTWFGRVSSKPLADGLQEAAVTATQLRDRGVTNGNHYVTRETKMSAVIVGAGFLSNQREEGLLKDPAFRTRFTKGVAKGIYKYLKDKHLISSHE